MSRCWSWRHAILNSSLPATTRHVLLTISCHMNDLGEGSYPTTAQLAGETGLSERSVCTHIEVAREAGWIEVTKHGFGGQKWKNHEYRAHWPSAEISQLDDRKALNEVQHVGTEGLSVASEKALNLLPKGTEPNDRKALNEVQSSIPSSIPERNSLSETSSDLAPKGKKSRINYPEAFEALWKAYPTHQNMSKKEGFDAWKKLDAEDRAAVLAAVPGYKAFLAKKPDLERQHLCRFISKRRFDGYTVSQQPAATEQVSDEQWLKRLRYARREQTWAVATWGPMPGALQCLVPANLIEPSDGQGWCEFENA